MVSDMKKIPILLLIISLCLLCACKQANPDSNANTQDPSSDPKVNQETDPEKMPEFDWETPIDVDDSFQEVSDETDPVTEPDNTDGDVEPSDPVSEPASNGNQGGTNGKPQVTDPSEFEGPADATDPDPTEDITPTEPEPTAKPTTGNSGPIELPMIPG